MTISPLTLGLKILRRSGCAPESDAAAKSLVEEIQAVAFEAAAVRLEEETKWYQDRIDNYKRPESKASFFAAAETNHTAAVIVRALKPHHAGEE